MAENTKIEWADHTFNPWVGCTRVSPACDHCYAEAWARRTGQPHLWTGERRRTSELNWLQPIRWDARAAREGRRFRVFCASLADVFDNQVPEEWRADLWALIAETPHLDWLLLTKRPQSISKMLPGAHVEQLLGRDAPWGKGWPNVWLGTTAENQAEADRRIPHLLATPAKVHFLSCEPLLGPLDLRNIYRDKTLTDALDGLSESPVIDAGDRMIAVDPKYRRIAPLDWIITGGESGPGARPMHPDWARSLRDQCAAAGVAFHFKQWGAHAPASVVLPDDHLDQDRDIMLPTTKQRAGRRLDGVEHNGMPR